VAVPVTATYVGNDLKDTIRRRVFQALREERARMADDASGDLRR
jgi:hypothetical protein